MSALMERGEREEMLLNACWKGDEARVRQLLADGDVYIDAPSEGGWTSLHWATCRNHANIVRILLDANADTETTDQEGATALHKACESGNLAIVCMLLEAKADIHVNDTHAHTPLHRALDSWSVAFDALCPIVFELVKHGAKWDDRCVSLALGEPSKMALGRCVDHWVTELAAQIPLTAVPTDVISAGDESVEEFLTQTRGLQTHDVPVRQSTNSLVWVQQPAEKTGNTSLHDACLEGNLEMVRVLLETGADVHATNACGDTPMHSALESLFPWSPFETHSILFLLASHGALWDNKCSDLSTTSTSVARASGWKRCVEYWAQQRCLNQPLTEIPFDAADAGAAAVDAFLSSQNSDDDDDFIHRGSEFTATPPHTMPTQTATTLRRRVYVMGDDGSGRTSWVRSMAAEQPTLTDEEGVEDPVPFDVHRVSLSFRGYGGSQYQVSLVDISGDRSLRLTAGALFLTRRAYVAVCVDLQAFAQAQAASATSEFLHRAVLPWIHLAVQHQQQAEVAIVGTKAELVADAAASITALKTEVEKHSVATVVVDWLAVSCQTPVGVLQARAQLETLLIKSTRHTTVSQLDAEDLHEIALLQREAVGLRGRERIDALVLTMEQLQAATSTENIERLYPINDALLWFEVEGAELLHNVAFLDWQLLVQLVQAVVTNGESSNSELLPHSTLVTLPVWEDLGQNLLLAVKQLLAYYGVVYAVDQEMSWDSDVLVPALWRSDATINVEEDVFLSGTAQYQPSVCVHWQFCALQPLPHSVLDRLVVASYSPLCSREIYGNGLLYRPSSSFVCAMAVDAAGIQLKAISLKNETAAWWVFSHVALAVERVLASVPDVPVSRRAINQQNESVRLETAVAAWAATPPAFRSTLTWLPPDLDWYRQAP